MKAFTNRCSLAFHTQLGLEVLRPKEYKDRSDDNGQYISEHRISLNHADHVQNLWRGVVLAISPGHWQEQKRLNRLSNSERNMLAWLEFTALSGISLGP